MELALLCSSAPFSVVALAGAAICLPRGGIGNSVAKIKTLIRRVDDPTAATEQHRQLQSTSARLSLMVAADGKSALTRPRARCRRCDAPVLDDWKLCADHLRELLASAHADVNDEAAQVPKCEIPRAHGGSGVPLPGFEADTPESGFADFACKSALSVFGRTALVGQVTACN
jgi:hypothetical protein